MTDANRPEPNYPIGSVDRALRLLLSFSEHKSVRVADASREIGVARSTAHRLLEMLQHHGFVEQDPESKAYVPGPALRNLGLSVVRSLDIRAIARPVIEELVEEVQETVHLVVLSRTDMMIIDSVESPQLLRIGGRIGDTLPAFAAAGGQALLSTLTPTRVRELYPSEKLPAVTPRTKTRRADLEAALESVRSCGYAVSLGEVEKDVSTVASPIHGLPGIGPAALTVSVPFTRMTADDIPRIARAVTEATARVSRQLEG